LLNIYEPVSKRFSPKSALICSRSRKAIRPRRINLRNTWSISRIALKVRADASLRVTKVPKFEPVEAKRRSRSSGAQRLDKLGRFEIGSYDFSLMSGLFLIKIKS